MITSVNHGEMHFLPKGVETKPNHNRHTSYVNDANDGRLSKSTSVFLAQ